MGSAEENAVYKKTADRIISMQKARAVADRETTDTELASNSILLLGGPAINALTASLINNPDWNNENLKIMPDSFMVKNKTYQSPNQALLVSTRNPANGQKYLTLFMGLSTEAVARPSGTMFFYRWDHYVVFEGGRMLSKGELSAPVNLLEQECND